MQPNHIIIHHSLTKDSETVSWTAIRRYHKEVLGFRDVGYHYGIELVNDHYEVLKGRNWYDTGAHCIGGGMNRLSLGVCAIGNFDITPVPKEMWDLAVDFVSSQCLLHNIIVENIHGHRYFSNKSCPGRLFDLDKFRYDVRIQMNRERRKI